MYKLVFPPKNPLMRKENISEKILTIYAKAIIA